MLKQFTRLGSASTACKVAMLGAASIVVLSQVALAQSSDEEAVTIAAQTNDDEVAFVQESIIVTGSRLKREGVDTVYPATTVGSELLEMRAPTNVADLLNELPSFGTPGASPDGAQSESLVGQNHLNFLGLGSQRTLTLVNGRRFVSSNPPGGEGAGSGLQVDFNVIPMALIDRIETIGIGGSPIYGSDAVAGTINVILKDDYEGFDITGQYGLTGEGDSEEYRFQIVTGGNFADGRGNVTLAAEYSKQEGLHNFDRPLYTTNDPFYAADRNYGGDGVFRIFRNKHIDTFTNGGLISASPMVRASRGIGALADGTFYQFAPDGNLVPFTPGGVAPDNAFVWAIGGDGTDLEDVSSQIVSPVERLVFSGTSRYDITDNIRAFGEFQFATTEATELANQDGFQTATGPGGEFGPLLFSIDNPFLNSQARGVLTDNGLSQFYMNRYHTEVYDSSYKNENFLWRAVAGLQGDFRVGDREFNWEASFVRGENTIDAGGTMIIDGRFINALDAVTVTQQDLDEIAAAGSSLATFSGTTSNQAGDIVCRSSIEAAKGNIVGETGSGITDNHLPFITGCVPLNLFGEGAPSAAAIDWLTGPEDARSRLEQTVFNVNIGGELFDLPAGGVAFNIGAETRKEYGSYRPSTAFEISLGRKEGALPTEGEFTTKELFGEVLVPLVNSGMNIPFLYHAEFSGAYRYIDNSVTGSADVWTAGGRFAVNQDLSFRGNYTRSVRAPSIGELYAPVQNIFVLANDPCDYRYVAQGSPERAANCAAAIPNYDPNSFASMITSAAQLGTQGGNPDLKNETANSYTLGATYEPSWLEGLLFTIDYYNVELEDAITVLSLAQVMNACYDIGPSSPACAQFTRDANGDINSFAIGQTNAQTFLAESIDYRLAYSFDLGRALSRETDWGGIDLGMQMHQLLTRETSVAGESPLPVIGSFTNPEFSANFDITWRKDNLRVFWRTQWQPGAEIDLTGTRIYEDENGHIIRKTDAYMMHNASVSYSLDELFKGGPKAASLQLSVNNVFDSKPSTEELALGYYTLAQQRGRSFMLRATTSF